MVSFLDLEQKISNYIRNERDLALIKEAYLLAASKHEGQYRKSGEPYIIHPLSVALILAGLNVGPNTLIAAILHDVVEDTDCELKLIAEKFGNDVANIVDGVCTIAFYYGTHHILWYIFIVCKQLFCVFWQAIASVSKTWVIVVISYSWVKTNPFYYVLCI